MTVLAIDAVLYDAFGQRQMATMFTQLDQNHVILVLDPSRQTSTATLEHLFFRASSGPLVPLNMLVSVKAEQVPIIINHRGVFPAITLSFDLAQSKSKRRPVNVRVCGHLTPRPFCIGFRCTEILEGPNG